MNRKDILTLARFEMNKHGLINWTVRFVQSKSFAGRCYTYRWRDNPKLSTGRIELSTDYFDVFEYRDIIDTILHEIAHALTETEYKRTRTGKLQRISHGPAWKATAKRIGCSGERCVRKEAKQPEGKYRGVCRNGHVSHRHRLTDAAKFRSSCSQCSSTFSTENMFDWYEGNTLVHSRVTGSTVNIQRKVEQSAYIKIITKQGAPV